MKALEDTVKKEFFSKPRIWEIIKGKERLRFSGNIVDCVEQLRNNEYIELNSGLIPENYEHGQNFLKRGRKIQLLKYASREEAMKDKLPFFRQREMKFSTLEEGVMYAGYGWWGIRERRFSNVFLSSCEDGEKLFVFAENNKSKNNKIELLEYQDVKDVEKHGGKYILKVPSRSTRHRYHVALEGVPIGKKEDFANIYDLSYEHTCPSLVADITFRYAIPGKAFCPHVIAAYMKVAQYNYRNGNKNTMTLNPFAIASQQQVDFDRKLRENLVVKLKDYPRRRINMAEREILNWERVKLYGNPIMANPKQEDKLTFYVPGKEKIQKYDW